MFYICDIKSITLKFEEEELANYKRNAKWWNQSLEEYILLSIRLHYKSSKVPEINDAELGFYNLMIK